jgi:hypothetical protein
MTSFRPTLGADLPDGWQVKESITLLAPDGQANVIASSEPIDPDVDSHKYADSQAAMLRREFPGFSEYSSGPETVFGGRSGFERVFEWTPPDGVPVTQIQHYHASNGQGYTATATTPSRLFVAVESVLRNILHSVVITAPPPSAGKRLRTLG